jgi:hypothetical protein
MRKAEVRGRRGEGGALDELLAGFAVAFGHAVERSEVAVGKSTLAQSLRRPHVVVILDDVVQLGDKSFVQSFDAELHSERMDDVRLAGLIFLAGVGFDRNGDSFFEKRHATRVRQPSGKS